MQTATHPCNLLSQSPWVTFFRDFFWDLLAWTSLFYDTSCSNLRLRPSCGDPHAMTSLTPPSCELLLGPLLATFSQSLSHNPNKKRHCKQNFVTAAWCELDGSVGDGNGHRHKSSSAPQGLEAPVNDLRLALVATLRGNQRSRDMPAICWDDHFHGRDLRCWSPYHIVWVWGLNLGLKRQLDPQVRPRMPSL